MSQEIVTIQTSQKEMVIYNKDQIDLIKRTVAQGATDDELKLFVKQCERTQLDPFSKQIYFMKDKNGKVSTITSIDGFRLIAERSGAYEGQTKVEWCGADKIWTDVWLENVPPRAARVGVFKKNFREALYAVALFDEYAGKYQNGDLTFMWKKMSSFMIGKVAEALAIRKAFPNDLSGVYSSEEAEVIAGGSEAREVSQDKKQVDPPQSLPPADFVLTFGQETKGKQLKDVPPETLVNIRIWINKVTVDDKKPMVGQMLATHSAIGAYLTSINYDHF